MFRIGETFLSGRTGVTWLGSDPTRWMVYNNPVGRSGWPPAYSAFIIAIPFDYSSLTFVAWRIRASDGYWSITVNDQEVFTGIRNRFPARLYDDNHAVHSIGGERDSEDVTA